METLTIPKPMVKTEMVLPEIQKLNFDRIKFKLQHKEDGSAWTKEKADFAEEEYRRYLTLIRMYPTISIVPSKIMDEFWHQHILDTRAYREDCQKVFGKFIDHYPYFGIFGDDDKQNLINAFEQTKELYREFFGYEIGESEGARCEKHPCHVPSECKCRAPGTCR